MSDEDAVGYRRRRGCKPSLAMVWFQRLFGFPEAHGSFENFARTQASFEYDSTSGVLKSRVNGREFQAGTFSTPSLGELQRSCSLAQARAAFPGPLVVKEVVADVGELHGSQENQHALFQAASQFNCLEFVAEDVVPEDGISHYHKDKTQGPACATACAPGTVVRNYFALEGCGQTSQKQVECLAEMEKLLDNKSQNYFRVQGGYSLANEDGISRLGERLSKDRDLRESARSKLRVGVMSDTQVTCKSFGSRDHEGPAGHTQLVTQVYCSACAVGYAQASRAAWAPFASLVLEGAYEATMYAALRNAIEHEGENGSRRVFLTALGGGVFQNSIEWIVGAMERAFSRFRGIALEVTIVSYGRPTRGLQPALGEYHAPEGADLIDPGEVTPTSPQTPGVAGASTIGSRPNSDEGHSRDSPTAQPKAKSSKKKNPGCSLM